MESWQEEQLLHLTREKDEAIIFANVFDLAQQIGFDYCAYRFSYRLLPTPADDPHLNNFPPEWNAHYKAKNYLALDPVVAHCKRSVFPILWNHEAYASAPALWQDAQAHGLCHGWSQSVHGLGAMVSILSLARTEGAVTPRELYEKTGQTLWLCHLLHSLMAQKLQPLPPQTAAPRLTPRESEVLRAMAEGQSASNIAHSLGLTVRTVDFHVASIIKKLGASNKTSAVVRAAKCGLL